MEAFLPLLFCGTYTTIIFAVGYGIGRNGLPTIKWSKRPNHNEENL